ncbi:MAG: prenyltransferase [Bacteroidaceae bacterium]|nr:prenyltransferase [Bacteroidaceae bacterium]
MFNHSIKSWLIATRPWSFPASAMPILVTCAYLFWLGEPVNWYLGLWTLVNIVLFHAAANCWSDYRDYMKGVDREDTIGGTSIVSGEFKASEIKGLSFTLLAVAAAAGIGLMLCTGMELLYFGLAGLVLIIAYPWLKYHALGDLDILLTYSVLPIMGTSYVVLGYIDLETAWLMLPTGLITVGILHINNSRDIEQDRRANIRTLAMLMGKRLSAWVYVAEMLLPFVIIVIAVICGAMPWWSMAVAVALKPAIDNCRAAMKLPSEGMEAVAGVDEKTAQLQLVFSLLLTLSFIIPALISCVK